MRRFVIWTVHVGYWALLGLGLLTLYFFAVYVPAHARPVAAPIGSLWAWLRLMAGFAVLPGLLSFYVSYSVLFTWFLSRRQFGRFLLAGGLTALLAAGAGAGLASLPAFFGPAYLFGDGYASALGILLLMTLLAWLHGLGGALIRGGLTWYQDIRLKEALHRQNLETELALVKAQIDPHFLFNTLNNIDVLITKDAATASTYLNKLSGILRVLLYETRKERISLDREITYLQQYVDLQKIRTANAGYVQMQVKGPAAGQEIAPMLLLPFIENAFKHTDGHKASSQIRVCLQLSPGKLRFTCTNNVVPTPTTETAGGLGNNLLRKRLALLYPAAHQLHIRHDADCYRVELELSL
ncbi:sensor histidine kinase [Hymenobacter negativus]|uniref:Sensor histidine kinase n=1 Tax=Hymenobacter negativus TaxID=2795026 RepID=A0ABS3QLI0_9BACT|nr:sensor histidine kinase [Hymenobacter negativus]MBO2012101.1 sensor histidine kinase [Hymenobacter negativus]